MIKPLFSKLDTNYNTSSASIHRCTMPFQETSAIRMCEALAATDVRFLDEFKRAAGNKCPHGYLRNSLELAKILSRPHLLGVRNRSWKSQPDDDPPADIYGRRGIVCFFNIPSYAGRNHIDLWDRNSVVGNDYWDAESIWMWELIYGTSEKLGGSAAQGCHRHFR